MALHWPQLTYVALTLIGLGVTIANHGDRRAGTHNAWASLIARGLVFGLLYAGGFFGGSA